MSWAVLCEPSGENPTTSEGGSDENIGGMVIYAANGELKKEVSRVAWTRKHSRHTKTGFDTQFKREVKKAHTVVDALNNLEEEIAMLEWSVVCEPAGVNEEGTNSAGLVIILTDGELRTEVERIAFVRRNGKNRTVSFETQLKRSLTKAQTAADTVNDLNAALEDSENNRQAAVLEKIDEIFNKAQRDVLL